MKSLKIVLISLLVIGIFCSDYNPFENPANVKMVVIDGQKSIHSDTLANIFSSETLYVMGSVREEIDSFSLSVNKNRNFSDTTIIAPIAEGNYKFPFSFFDTGYVSIILTTYRKNGDDITEEFDIYVRNPLDQDTLIISEFVVETLFTTPVTDTGITYNWCLSPTLEEIYTYSQKSNRFTGNITDFNLNRREGYLWVEDSKGNVSPLTIFNYQFNDTTGPILSSDNDGYIASTNVIVTGDKTFNLKILCDDLSGINTATINDSSFDSYDVIYYNSYRFKKTLYRMDTLTDSMAIIINASDLVNHVSTDTFYIKYDASGPKEVFRLLSPSIQPYTTGSQNYNIQMEVFNLFESPMYVYTNHIEGGVIDTLDTIAVSDSSKILSMSVSLASGDNVITFTAVDSEGVETAVWDTVLISYNASVQDTNSPHIINTSINGLEGDKPTITVSTAILELSAYDDNLDSVIINGKYKALSNTYKWYDTMTVSKGLSSFSVRLVDKAGNVTEKDIWFYKNSTPYISDSPLWPKTLVVGTPWVDTLTISDEDGDTVKLRHQIRTIDGGSAINPVYNTILNSIVTFNRISRLKWQVLWEGDNIQDTLKGKNIPTQIYLSDNISDTSYNWDFSIVDSGDAKPFDFTVVLPENIDTTANGEIDLSQILDTIVLNGKIESNSQLISETDTITLTFEEQTVKYNSTNGSFDIVIDVGNKDISNESIIITVTDTLGYVTIVDTLDLIYYIEMSDTLFDEISWHLRTENPENVITDVTDTAEIVKKWLGEGIELIENSNIGDSYPYNPTLIEDSELPIDVIHFSRSGKNSLYDVYDIGNNDFTIFIVARLGENAKADSTYCLISASDISKYTGFGVENGRMGMIGDSTVDIMSASELRGGPYVMDKKWHIYTIASSTGIIQHSDGNNTRNIFPANLWLDGIKTDCDSCVSVGTPSTYPYFVLGGGGKHHAFNAWEGDVAEIIMFERALSKSEIDNVNSYIASEFKIDINKYGNKGVQIKRDK